MSIVAKLSAIQAKPTSKKCAVAEFLDSLHPSESGKAAELVMDPGRSASQMSEILKAEGYDVSVGILRRHRRRECRCP